MVWGQWTGSESHMENDERVGRRPVLSKNTLPDWVRNQNGFKNAYNRWRKNHPDEQHIQTRWESNKQAKIKMQNDELLQHAEDILIMRQKARLEDHLPTYLPKVDPYISILEFTFPTHYFW